MAGLLSILVKDYEGFTGKIGRTVAESEAAWPPNRHPGEKAHESHPEPVGEVAAGQVGFGGR